MVVMTPSISTKLLNTVQDAYPSFSFERADRFSWCSNVATIFYNTSEEHGDCILLHELAHALLNHQDYTTDIALIEMERQAWSYAAHILAPQFDVALSVDDSVVQDALDSYRDWLHARSRCPKCAAVGVQVQRSLYRCLHCQATWSVNEARACELRRHIQ